MDTANIVLIICIVFFAYRGYKAGVLLASSRILAFIAGYAASLLYAQSLANWLIERHQISSIGASLLAGIGLFVAVSTLVNQFAKLFIKLTPKTLQQAGAMRWGGAGVGATTGFVIAMITLWFYGFLQAMMPVVGIQTAAITQVSSTTPTIAQQLLKQTSKLVAEQVVKQTGPDDLAAQATALLMTQPAETLQSFQRLSQNSTLKNLLQAPANQQVLMSGDAQAIAQLPDFQVLRNNPDIQQLLGRDGIESADLAHTLATVWRRARTIQDDPELQALLQDPELQQQMQSGNLIALLSNPKSAQLMTALLSHQPQKMSHQPAQTAPQSPAQDKSPQPITSTIKPTGTKIHRWVDKNGKVHYTDKEP